jgi:hypothetical protein
MPAVQGWVGRCRGGRRGWFDVDCKAYVGKFATWPEAITDGVHVWERTLDPTVAPPLRVVKGLVVLLYPFRRRVICSDVVDVAAALEWPLEQTRSR